MGLVQQTIEAAQQYWQFRETWREQFVPVLLLHMRMDEWRKLQETLIVIVFHSWLRLRSPRLLSSSSIGSSRRRIIFVLDSLIVLYETYIIEPGVGCWIWTSTSSTRRIAQQYPKQPHKFSNLYQPIGIELNNLRNRNEYHPIGDHTVALVSVQLRNIILSSKSGIIDCEWDGSREGGPIYSAFSFINIPRTPQNTEWDNFCARVNSFRPHCRLLAN